MKKIRQIKQYGNTIVIKLNPSDLGDMGWKFGDWVDIIDCVKVNDGFKTAYQIQKEEENEHTNKE